MEPCPPCRQLEPHTGMEGLIQLGQASLSTPHQPADGQFQLLEGGEDDQVVTKVITGRAAASIGWILWESPIHLTQEGGKEKLLSQC